MLRILTFILAVLPIATSASSQIIDTVAGAATSASLRSPYGMAVDSNGNH